MPWGAFSLLLLLVYVVQTALISLLDVRAVDLFLALALLCGLVMPVHDARICAWICGLLQGLGSQDTLGVHALLLGGCAVILTRLRALVNLNLWWVRGLVAFLAAWPTQIAYLLFLRLIEQQPIGWFKIIFGSALIALLAALLAALVTALPILVSARRPHARLGGARR